MAEPDGKKDAAVDAAFVLAKHDLRRGTEPGSGTESVGMVELIALAAKAERSMRAVSAAEAVEGRGLLGDRYERGAGTFSNPRGRGYDLTLVEAEALEELSAKGVELAPIEARRNLVVRGIALDDLIGRRFRVGEVECFGQRRCEPCAHLERLTQPGVLRGLVHRGGLRADVLSDGEIRIGDRVEALPKGHPRPSPLFTRVLRETVWKIARWLLDCASERSIVFKIVLLGLLLAACRPRWEPNPNLQTVSGETV